MEGAAHKRCHGLAMLLSIDQRSPLPPYEQLRSQIAAMIADRVLMEGTRLPTIRGLARDLELAPNTVARAYRELEEAGIVETRGRHGTFIRSPKSAPASAPEREARLARAARAFAREARLVSADRASALAHIRRALDSV